MAACALEMGHACTLVDCCGVQSLHIDVECLTALCFEKRELTICVKIKGLLASSSWHIAPLSPTHSTIMRRLSIVDFLCLPSVHSNRDHFSR